MSTSAANLPYYGRKWKIVVERSDGSKSWTVSDSDFDNAEPDRAALRCTFNIVQNGYHCPWYSEVSIWNLRGDTRDKMIGEVKEGMKVKVWAGYVNGNYGKIFEGDVFQPLFDRQNVTDFVLTMHCIVGMNLIHANFVSFALKSGYDYATMLKNMANNSTTKIPISNITESLDKTKAPRGMVMFGDQKKYLRQTSIANNAQWWVNQDGLNVTKLKDSSSQTAIVLTPKTGLIGTPQQIDYGVSFRCLMNPNISVKTFDKAVNVKLDMAVIRQMKIQQGAGLVTPLDLDGIYKVIHVTYRGDTRGQDWYTDVIGVNEKSREFLMMEQNS